MKVTPDGWGVQELQLVWDVQELQLVWDVQELK